ASKIAGVDGGFAQERKVPCGRQLLQRRVRGDSLHSAAGAAPARRPVGGLSRHRGLVGAHARAALGQGGGLRSHDREGLGTVQEPRARSLAQGAGAAASQLNPNRSNSRWARGRRARTTAPDRAYAERASASTWERRQIRPRAKE